MSRKEIDSSIPPAIAGILQNLSSRPNVESTLILSRVDGTIIYATGNLSVNKRDSIAGLPGSSELATNVTTVDASSMEAASSELHPDRMASQSRRAMSPAEALAASVFHFVHSAAMLGRAAGRSRNDRDGQDAARASVFETAPTSTGDDQNPDEHNESTHKEDQAQLLRMRTKRQEIIIYPDVNYLCCVIQSVGKQVNGTS